MNRIEYHLSSEMMLKYLERFACIKTWAKRLGIDNKTLSHYKRGEKKVTQKNIYESILAEYYRIRGKEKARRLLKLTGRNK